MNIKIWNITLYKDTIYNIKFDVELNENEELNTDDKTYKNKDLFYTPEHKYFTIFYDDENSDTTMLQFEEYVAKVLLDSGAVIRK